MSLGPVKLVIVEASKAFYNTKEKTQDIRKEALKSMNFMVCWAKNTNVNHMPTAICLNVFVLAIKICGEKTLLRPFPSKISNICDHID